LARLEGRVALDEMLKRFTDWDIDLDQSELGYAPGVRGYARLRVMLP
jgi:hypothetical protein